MKRGLFITFEGPDGAGKTTQFNRLSQYLKQQGFDPIVTREPGGTPIGEKIRELLLDTENKEMDPAAEMLLYAASRAQHVSQVIKPALEMGKIVLCDRFVDSSAAYQGVGRGLGIETVEAVNLPALHGIEPDLTLFFNLSPEEGLKRRFRDSQKGDRLEQEQMDFHQKVYRGFCILRDRYPQRIREIDASQSEENIFRVVLEAVKQLISGKN